MIKTQVIEPPNEVKEKKSNFIKILYLLILFFIIFISVRILIQKINDSDYIIYSIGGRAVLNGQNIYSLSNPGYVMPPWSAFFLAPISQQPVETWLALDVALFVTASVDLGSVAAIVLIVHPSFITLIASANPEWLLVGTGLWLLYRAKRGWFRGIAWLFLMCKPQTTFFLLLADAWQAFRTRDWKAFGLCGGCATILLLLYPQFFKGLPFNQYSMSTVSSYGVPAAIAATAFILVLRRNQLRDIKTLGLLLAPIWAPYTLEYSEVAVVFTLRGAAWWRILLYMLGSIGLVAIFWRDYHVSEAAGVLGITLLAALLAPAYSDIPPSETLWVS